MELRPQALPPPRAGRHHGTETLMLPQPILEVVGFVPTASKHPLEEAHPEVRVLKTEILPTALSLPHARIQGSAFAT